MKNLGMSRLLIADPACHAPCRHAQVLYSQFVALLDEGKVKAARLESGTSRIYFDLKMSEAAASAPTAAMAATAVQNAASSAAGAVSVATAPLVPSASTATVGESATSASSSMAAAAAATTTVSGATSTARHMMQKQYFIKVCALACPT